MPRLSAHTQQNQTRNNMLEMKQTFCQQAGIWKVGVSQFHFELSCFVVAKRLSFA